MSKKEQLPVEPQQIDHKWPGEFRQTIAAIVQSRLPPNIKLKMVNIAMVAMCALGTPSAVFGQENPGDIFVPPVIGNEQLMRDIPQETTAETGVREPEEIETELLGTEESPEREDTPDIYMGEPVTPEEFDLWGSAANLENPMYDKKFQNRGAGGVVVSENPPIVLTCAHCVDEGVEPFELSVGIGILDRTDPKKIQIPVGKIEFIGADMALLFLANPIPQEANVKEASLLPEGTDLSGKKIIITGWGRTTPPGTGSSHDQSDVLQKAEGPYTPPEECDVGSEYFCVGDGEEPGSGSQTNYGDSGSAAYVKIDGKTYLVGPAHATRLDADYSIYGSLAPGTAARAALEEAIAAAQGQPLPPEQQPTDPGYFIQMPSGGFLPPDEELSSTQSVQAIADDRTKPYDLKAYEAFIPDEYLSDTARAFVEKQEGFVVSELDLTLLDPNDPCLTIGWDDVDIAPGSAWVISNLVPGEHDVSVIFNPEQPFRAEDIYAGTLWVSTDPETCEIAFVDDPKRVDAPIKQEFDWTQDFKILVHGYNGATGEEYDATKNPSYRTSRSIMVEVYLPVKVPATTSFSTDNEVVIAATQPGGTTTLPPGMNPLHRGKITGHREGDNLVLEGYHLWKPAFMLRLWQRDDTMIYADDPEGTYDYSFFKEIGSYFTAINVTAPSPSSGLKPGESTEFDSPLLESPIIMRRVGDALEISTFRNLVIGEKVPYIQVQTPDGDKTIDLEFVIGDSGGLRASKVSTIEEYFRYDQFLPIILNDPGD